ncbi:MAG: hypothetical protein K2H01_04035 [Ruminococcus sp.]|nr:hypothetical protein [Ruminococcus sp.]
MKNTLTNILLVLLSISVLAMIGTIFYHFFDTDYQTETAVPSSAELSVTMQGVYVRDETILSYNGQGCISYNVPDGGKVCRNGAVADIYGNNAAIKQNQQIEALEKELEVLKKISNTGVLEMAQPASLSNQVSQYYNQIVYYRDLGNLDSMKQAEEDFRAALGSYQIVINQGTTNYTEQISMIEDQIASLKLQKQNPIDTILSPNSAYFASYADGYEEKLSIANISSITKQDLESVTNDESLKSSTIIGKTIASYGWYMLGVIDNTNIDFKVGDRVTIYLSTSSASTRATITELRPCDSENEVMLVLYSENMASDFVQHRTERVRIVKDVKGEYNNIKKGEYNGIKVPRMAIRFRDIPEDTTNVLTGEVTTALVNYRGVYILDGEEISFRKLDVIYEGDNYVLSAVNKESDYLQLYDSIIVEGIDASGGAD